MESTRKLALVSSVAAGLLLLGFGSSGAQEDRAAVIENEIERGDYPLAHGRVVAVLRIEDTRASITTFLEPPDEENAHGVILSGSCHSKLPYFREIRDFRRGDRVEYECPPGYFIEWSSATLQDFDDVVVTPDDF